MLFFVLLSLLAMSCPSYGFVWSAAEPAEDGEPVARHELPRETGAGLDVHLGAGRRVGLDLRRERVGVVAVVRADEQVLPAAGDGATFGLELLGEGLSAAVRVELDPHFPFRDVLVERLLGLLVLEPIVLLGVREVGVGVLPALL